MTHTFPPWQPCISNWAYFLHVTHMNLLSTTAMHKQLSILSTCDSYVPSLNDSFVWTIDHAFYVCTYWLIATGCTFFSNKAWMNVLFLNCIRKLSMTVLSFQNKAWMNVLSSLCKLSMTILSFQTKLERMFFIICASSAWLFFLCLKEMQFFFAQVRNR